MKPVRWIVLGIAAIGMVAAAAVRPADAQTITAGPTTAGIVTAVNDTVTVPLRIDLTGASGIALGAFRVRFTWDPAVVAFAGSSSGSFGSMVINADTAAQGVAWLAGANAQGVTGTQTLGALRFRVLTTAGSTTFAVQFSELTAAVTFQNLLPFLTSTSFNFCPGRLVGDLDANSLIQSLDAQIVAMHAVGIAVPDTTAGDADADGKVNTRDALLILSHVVGLDVSAFKVGKFLSGVCTPGVPATLTVLPAAVQLAAGDLFTARGDVRDGGGGLLGGVNLTWTSDNTAAATVDRVTGRITAVAAGSAVITATAVPGVSGSVTVTVGPRRRWRVDPATAQGQASAIGSDLYPFATIAEAVARAADYDTISIAAGNFTEPLNATKPLAFVGDSGAAGMPRISVPQGSAGQLTAAGFDLRRLRIAESGAGLVIRADSVRATSLQVSSVRGPGLVVRRRAGGGPVRADLRGVTVSGAVSYGINVDSARAVSLTGIRVTSIEGTAADTARGIRLWADSVRVDSATVQGVAGTGIYVIGVARTQVLRSLVTDAVAGVLVDFGIVFEATNVSVHRVSPGGAIGGRVDTMRVRGGSAIGIAGAAVYMLKQYGLLEVWDFVARDIGTGVQTVSSTGNRRADIRRSEFRQSLSHALTPWADTLFIDSTLVRGTLGTGAMGVRLSPAVVASIHRSQFSDLASSAIYQGAGAGYVEITGTSARGVRSGDAISLWADSARLVNDTIHGVAVGDGLYASLGSWLRLHASLIRRTSAYGVYAVAPLVNVARVNVDSAGQWGIYLQNADSARVDSSRVSNSYYGGIYPYLSRTFHALRDTLVGNAQAYRSGFGGTGTGASAIYTYGVDTVLVRRNVFTDNYQGSFYAFLDDAAADVRFDSNTVRGGWPGVYVRSLDSLSGRAEVRGNAFTGWINGNGSYQVYAFLMRTAIVEDNAIDSAPGYGVLAYRADTMTVRNNVLQRLSNNGTGVHANLNVTNTTIDGNTVSCWDRANNSAMGIDFYYASGAISNNVVTACYIGGRAFNAGTLVRPLTVSGNRFVAGTLAPSYAGFYVEGRYNAEFSNNVATGGAYSGAGLGVLSSSFYRTPWVRMVGDSVTNGYGRGIVLQYVDSALVDGAVVTGIDSLGVFNARESGLYVTNVFDTVRVVRSKFINNGVTGVLLADRASRVWLDTNLIADNVGFGCAGVFSGNCGGGISLMANHQGSGVPDTVRGTLNSVRRNSPYGLYTYNIDVLMPANNFEGNTQYGVFNNVADTVNVASSWWGNTLGPRCTSGCDVGSTGDSATSTVIWSPAAAAVVAGAPAGAPPARAGAAGFSLLGRRGPRVIGAPPEVPRAAAPAAAPEAPRPIKPPLTDIPEPRLLPNGALVLDGAVTSRPPERPR